MCDNHRNQEFRSRFDLKAEIARNKKVTKSASSKLFLDPDEMKVAVFDIETTGLKGDFDIILCGVIKTFGTRTKGEVFSIDLREPDLIKAEEWLIRDINNCLSDYDGVITYYGSRFDVPMLRTRSYYHGLPAIRKIKHLDVYFTMKRTVNTTSRRMDRINELLRVSDPATSPEKTRTGMSEWMAAMFSRDEVALGYIVDHCIKDVDILENIVNKFVDFIPDRIMRM